MGSASPEGSGAPEGGSAAAEAGWSDPREVGKPYGDKVKGLLTFRGNPTRTYYGEGPEPRADPKVLWRFPRSGGLCAESTDPKSKSWLPTASAVYPIALYASTMRAPSLRFDSTVP